MTLLTKGISIVGVLGFLLLALQTYRISSLNEEIDRWKANLDVAVATNATNEKVIAIMDENYKRLQTTLVEWKAGYETIDEQLGGISTNIRKLRKGNEEIRTVLSTTVPCELWLELFPSTTQCPGGSQGPKNPDPTNPGTANK